jgi:hypothetical protein
MVLAGDHSPRPNGLEDALLLTQLLVTRRLRRALDPIAAQAP